MKQLIVRADDLGYSEAISLGILAAHSDGIVTCTSVMVNMPYAKKALELATQYPNLSLGLHVNVTNEYALADNEKIPELIDEDGKFVSSTIRRQQISKGETLFSEEQAYIEAVAQLEKFKQLTGKMPDYIDLHVLEEKPLIEAICRVQKDYGIKGCPYADNNLKDANTHCMDQYNFYQGEKKEFVEYFEEYFNFDNPVSLIVCHPGFLDLYAFNTTSMLKERVLDYGLVTDQKVKEWLQKNEVELVNFINYKKG